MQPSEHLLLVASVDMIDLYFSPTPNGLKVQLFLEETGIPYRLLPVRLSAGEQFAPEFVAISPNSKIPVIVDSAPADLAGPLAVFESGTILLHLSESTGRLLSTDARERLETLQWLFWQTSALGPIAGQTGYFRVYAPLPEPAAIERYTRELRRLYGVLDRRLEGRDYIVGNACSIADIACYPWIVPHQNHGQDLAEFPNLSRWFAAIGARPATQRVYTGVEDVYSSRGSPVAICVTP